MSPLFSNGVTIPAVQLLGNLPLFSILLNRYVSARFMYFMLTLSISLSIESLPGALPFFSLEAPSIVYFPFRYYKIEFTKRIFYYVTLAVRLRTCLIE